jgi:hypothetical protein
MSLTPREREIVRRFGQGETIDELARGIVAAVGDPEDQQFERIKDLAFSPFEVDVAPRKAVNLIPAAKLRAKKY